MYEELYIVENGKRFGIDLATPSGITLVYKSNIFGDLSKITCSYTYTFKLPLTANNRRIFDNADDIRCASNKIRKRLTAIYIQNGIPLFNNANLYIDSTENCYNAVMTWGVIDGFSAMKDNDISIKELNYEEDTTFGPVSTLMSSFKNDVSAVRPLYNAGATYVSPNGNKNTYIGYNFFPLPCVPIYKIVQLINAYYSTNFVLGEDYSYGDSKDMNNLLKFGVIPLVSAKQSDEEINSNATDCFVHSMTSGYKRYEKPNIIHGYASTPGRPMNWQYFEEVRDTEGKLYGLKNKSNSKVFATIKGYFGFTIKSGSTEITSNSETKPVLKVYGYSSYSGISQVVELASVDGTYKTHYSDEYSQYGDGNLRWRFEFTEKYGSERIEVEIPANTTVFFGIECGDKTDIVGSGESDPPVFYPELKPESNRYSATDTSCNSWPIPIGPNLPDISCMTLMKALFYMIGAFPTTDSSGNIVPMYYDSLKENIINGVANDWSNKVTTDVSVLPNKTTYTVSGFGQRNYYLMKNDNLDSKGAESESDVYASGIGVIECNNETIEKKKTIIQLPFYGAYLHNLKNKKFSTGNTIKFWVRENEVKTVEAKPAFGLVTPFIQKKYDGSTGNTWLGLEIWDGFANILLNPSYAYLARIMENPVIITENLLLNELDLRSLDYSVPVYLSKYGAYFAIVSITRDSKGICKCELIKLPEEE